jgi:hypothetical protein
MRAREALAGIQTDLRRQSPETTVDDDRARSAGDVPVVPAADQAIPLVVNNQPWQQAGPPAASQDAASGRSSQSKHDLILRMRVWETPAGIQPDLWRQSPETTVDDDQVRNAEDVPVVPAADQTIPLVLKNLPWQQAGPATACQDAASGRSTPVEESLDLQEPQKEDEGEVLPCLMEDKRSAWGWRS